jgi:hypothetical protein
MSTRSPYPTEVGEEEWAIVATCWTSLPKDAGQQCYLAAKELYELNWCQVLLKSSMLMTVARWIRFGMPANCNGHARIGVRKSSKQAHV